MAAAGVVCLQEFAQYDDWRIEKSMEVVAAAVRDMAKPSDPKKGPLPSDEQFFPYAIYYIGQALYQVGGSHWQTCYPLLRDYLVHSQIHAPQPERDGMWEAHGSVQTETGADVYDRGCLLRAGDAEPLSADLAGRKDLDAAQAVPNQVT